jgi:hypothetical protein
MASCNRSLNFEAFAVNQIDEVDSVHVRPSGEYLGLYLYVVCCCDENMGSSGMYL